MQRRRRTSGTLTGARTGRRGLGSTPAQRTAHCVDGRGVPGYATCTALRDDLLKWRESRYMRGVSDPNPYIGRCGDEWGEAVAGAMELCCTHSGVYNQLEQMLRDRPVECDAEGPRPCTDAVLQLLGGMSTGSVQQLQADALDACADYEELTALAESVPLPDSGSSQGPTGPRDCPVGTIYVDGQCVAPDSPTDCPSGEIRVDGKCWPVTIKEPQNDPLQAQRAGLSTAALLLISVAGLSLLVSH